MAEAKAVKKTGFFKGLKGEYKKIIWPNFNNLMKQTMTVIVVSAIIGGLVFLIDAAYQAGVVFLLG